MTTDEKRKLGAGLCHLSPDDLNKALEIVAQDNPSFQTKAEEVDLDMDAQVLFYVLLCAFFLFVVAVTIISVTGCGLELRKEHHLARRFDLIVFSYHFCLFCPVRLNCTF